MFRNNYDNDSVTFSPQGRIFQVEYAAEAVKQGSVVVGIASKTHVVLAAIKRNAEELSSYQKKLFEIDEHVGIAIAGLTSDARVLSNFMKQKCLSHRLTYDRHLPVRNLVDAIGYKAQVNTQHYGKRPYGVGLLVAGVDNAGATHLFEFQPSGMTEEMQAFAIGARSQMARTYLERHLDKFAECARDDLIRHALAALNESLVQDRELTVENTSIAVVGVVPPASEEGVSGTVSRKKCKIEPFQLYDGPAIKGWIDRLADDRPSAAAGEDTRGGGGGEDSMEVDS